MTIQENQFMIHYKQKEQNDEIWNHQFDNNYIASWGGFAPENEIKGVISPIIFPGLPDFWYVELRIPATY